jgi:hypothetical protein
MNTAEKVAARFAGVRFEQQVGKPAEADEALGQAYVKLVSFKQGLDAMEEIPAHLKPLYSQVMKAMDEVGEARKHTYQLRMMVQKISR